MLDVKENKKKVAYYVDEYRIYIALVVVFIIMSAVAPNFFNLFNIGTILKAASMPAMVAIGFTLVMICGHFDLSIGATLNLGAILVIGQYEPFKEMFLKLGFSDNGAMIAAWGLSLVLALAAGALVGIINGYLVGKVKIHSFIVTLGTMTAVKGAVYLYCHGSSLCADDFTFSDFIDTPVLPLLTPRVIVTIIFVALFGLFLKKTKFGRGFYMVGGNAEAAWLAGLDTEKYVILAFTISGLMASLGGSLFAISLNSAVPNLGERGVSPLMLVLASTLIGGTSITGGKGSVVQSAIAVLVLMIIFNGLTCFGVGFEAQILASGVLLAIVVLYEAYATYKQNLTKGQRPDLVKEAAALKANVLHD